MKTIFALALLWASGYVAGIASTLWWTGRDLKRLKSGAAGIVDEALGKKPPGRVA